MGLDAWQDRLERHFSQLRAERSSPPPDTPLFALDHGLSRAELAELASEIRAAAHARRSSHWLPWVVYATELGYMYEGHEYWQTFEQETPECEGQPARYWLRSCFFRFRDQLGGFEPSGRWAEHFTIICWPIAHAVLPTDLQTELARTLYKIRHSLSDEHLRSPERLGILIARRSTDCSSRFQNFVTEPVLVGRIAQALLFPGEAAAAKLLMPATLNRIIDDLERKQFAREWLQKAKHTAGQTRRRGLLPPTHGSARPPCDPEIARKVVFGLGVEPHLVLRPTAENSWEVFLRIPDLVPLADRFPELDEVLHRSRCAVAGSSGRPLAPGRVLSQSRSVKLRSWPKPDQALLIFEDPDELLASLMRTQALLGPGPTWLLRVGADGLAQQVHSRVVRPGNSYLLLSQTLPSDANLPAAPVKVHCSGISGARLDMPTFLSRSLLASLTKAGLAPCGAVEFRPIGLPPKNWDGEGRVEYLSTDPLCIAVSTDHDIGEVALELDGDSTETMRFSFDAADDVQFVELPALTAGAHAFRVIRTSDASGSTVPRELGALEVSIVHPSSWTPDDTESGGLAVRTTPERPALEDLWEGRATLDVDGPLSYKARCDVRLYEEASRPPIWEQAIGGLPLPISATDWHKNIVGQLGANADFQAKYERSRYSEVEFSVDSVGQCVLRCEREMTPIRWLVKHSGRRVTLELTDDTGAAGDPVVKHYAFAQPDTPVEVHWDRDGPLLQVVSESGMYVGEHGSSRCSIVTVPEQMSLPELKLAAEFAEHERTERAIDDLLSTAELWASARIAGGAIATDMRRRTACALMTEVFGIIGGRKWRSAEEWFAKLAWPTSGDVARLSTAVWSNKFDEDLARGILDRSERLAAYSPQERVEVLTQLVERNQGQRDLAKTVELALRLASCAQTLRDVATEGERAATIRFLLNAPVVARAARFVVVVASALAGTPGRIDSPVYQGWRWS